MAQIQPNAYVTLDYTLKDEDGTVLDASEVEGGAPIQYVHGYGMLVPGLEAALAGLEPGDEREIVVPAEAGYGEYDDELVLEIDRSELPDPSKVEVGDEFVAEVAGRATRWRWTSSRCTTTTSSSTPTTPSPA